jgi:quercetin dioxygenase-like cupin family protein
MSDTAIINAKVFEPGDGMPLQILDAEITIRVSSRETGGAFTTFDGRIPPLQGPPLHRHQDEDESFYIVDGAFRFEVDGEEIYAGPGATVFARRGTAHTFQNIGGTTGHILTTAVPGGLDLYFEEMAATLPPGATPDLRKMAPIFEKHHIELLGPPLAARNFVTASAAD